MEGLLIILCTWMLLYNKLNVVGNHHITPRPGKMLAMISPAGQCVQLHSQTVQGAQGRTHAL